MSARRYAEGLALVLRSPHFVPLSEPDLLGLQWAVFWLVSEDHHRADRETLRVALCVREQLTWVDTALWNWLRNDADEFARDAVIRAQGALMDALIRQQRAEARDTLARLLGEAMMRREAEARDV